MTMIKKLKRRLILLFTITTGVILSLVVLAAFLISRMTLLSQVDKDFQNHIMNIGTRLQTDRFINVSWLASMEAGNGLIIHIEENGNPLMYRSSWRIPSDREYLIQEARTRALELNTDLSVRPVSSASVSPVYRLTGQNGDQYQCIALSYPTDTGYISMLLLSYISPALRSMRHQLLLFLTADAAGILGLYLVIRLFVSKAVRPVQESSRKQREFVAAASHELRSPLMVIQSSAQAIDKVPEKTSQFTHSIQAECRRMGTLIDDLLTLASFDAGSWSVVPETLDLQLLLLDFYERYEPLCEERMVPLRLSLPDELLPEIKGDRARLLQVLTILTDNALSYNRDHNPIELEAGHLKSHIYIKVIDHGQGIADDKKELIFDRFYREDSSRKDKQHAGLGLCIARELVACHKGTLQVTDTPGGGSTFTVRLPAIRTGKGEE